jgi:hypothetical protein
VDLGGTDRGEQEGVEPERLGKTVSELRGFWSYVRSDDEAERGRIAELARDVVSEYALLTGDEVDVFLDRDSIEWGDNWRDVIDGSLASVAFFVPVLTPRYFLSAPCRGELGAFLQRATQLGVRELVLPILYASVADLDRDEPEDDLARRVASIQREDWRQLRFAERASSEYRTAVNRLAARLVEANRVATEVEATATVSSEIPGKDDEDVGPGLIDRLVGAEEALPHYAEKLVQMTKEAGRVGELLNLATEEVRRGDAQGSGFGNRLRVARTLARDLSSPTDGVVAAASECVSLLRTIDSGIRDLIQAAPAEVRDRPESKEAVCGFLQSLRESVVTTERMMVAIEGSIDAIEPLENASRDLRPVIRRLRRGLAAMLDARGITQEWNHLMQSSGLKCDESD